MKNSNRTVVRSYLLTVNSTMEEAKARFEKEREKILSEIPAEVKAQFGQIGFAEMDGERGVPVLVLNPYDIPPRPFRDVYWFDMFSKSKGKKGKPMSHVVYHYGSDDPDDCYSFVELDKFEPYESGKEKGYGQIGKVLQDKIDSQVELSEEEQALVRSIEEMLADVPKEPGDRKRGVLNFKERHETLSEKKPPPKKKQKTR